MEVALKCYRPHRKEPLFPSFALPPPFFNQNESVIDDEMVYESILSEADLKRLEISVFKGRKQQVQTSFLFSFSTYLHIKIII